MDRRRCGMAARAPEDRRRGSRGCCARRRCGHGRTDGGAARRQGNRGSRARGGAGTGGPTAVRHGGGAAAEAVLAVTWAREDLRLCGTAMGSHGGHAQRWHEHGRKLQVRERVRVVWVCWSNSCRWLHESQTLEGREKKLSERYIGLPPSPQRTHVRTNAKDRTI